ncbi:hypothetical protein JJ685_25925 [Ramlibacter monticola]|uniref:Uncharacterized protein n=1 Tax=Ramlibacter monticola TaxID=1926872 RepID=A0A936Z5B0_9BURK|nr:hypothetical protein [Ramlibacter monticola]MBL0394602.1 hypothetical protein [Ramlibacter monticola]
MPRSTYYYRSTAQAAGLSDERVVELIARLQLVLACTVRKDSRKGTLRLN